MFFNDIKKIAYKKLKENDGEVNVLLEVRILLQNALSLSKEDYLISENLKLSDSDITNINGLIERRLNGESLARILGIKEFYGHEFQLNTSTLEPRADSETLVDAVLSYAKHLKSCSILDLGTGTGCLILSILKKCTDFKGIGIDVSQDALDIAAQNAHQLNLDNRIKFIKSDWFENINEKFDIIISNPPYIKTHDIPTLQREVKYHDPVAALDGGHDGLVPYKHLIPQLSSYLKRGGRSFFEIGQSQLKDIENIISFNNFTLDYVHLDLAGISRVVEISYGDNQK